MKTIYYCEKSSISYSDNDIQINGVSISEIPEKSEEINILAYSKMRDAYSKVLARQYENIVVLSGAGTSFNIGVGTKKGKTMKGLWEASVKAIGIEKLRQFAKDINFKEISDEYTDLESMLSQAILAEAYDPRQCVRTVIAEIEDLIRLECTLELPNNSPHFVFLQKLLARKMKYSRAKIFTLNYDLLFEQAASNGGYVIIDGFSFNTPRIFNGINFDYDIVIRNTNRSLSEENYASKVFHLYKPHGSLDWERKTTSTGDDVFLKRDNPENPIMIYPSSSKYEASYEQPYFEMISRFQQELRSKNTLLLTIGFSFYDKHIKAMIMEALNSNPSITIIVVSPDVIDEKKYIDLKEKSQKMKNIILISETFEEFTNNYPQSDIYDYESEGGVNSEPF